jgi:hypothetical protein
VRVNGDLIMRKRIRIIAQIGPINKKLTNFRATGEKNIIVFKAALININNGLIMRKRHTEAYSLPV